MGTADRESMHSRLESPAEVADCLEVLMGAGGASLLLVRPGSVLQPVVVREARRGEWLRLDIDSAREAWSELKRGAGFFLLGHRNGETLRSGELSLAGLRDEDGRLHGYSAYPGFFDVVWRRDSYRAELRLGMVAFGALAAPGGTRVSGVLRDLSLGGCQLCLPVEAVSLLGSQARPLLLTLSFPDGTELTLEAVSRHEWTDLERGEILAGFRFEHTTPSQERQLWVLVREIEREAARYRHEGAGNFQPSPLFSAGARQARAPQSREGGQAMPMARRLGRIADYLDVQVLKLRRGEAVDSSLLSLNADRLLALLDEDREEALFAVACLDREPLVSHCLAVAVRLVDLAGRQRQSPQLRKALAASAMIHDLGRALLPSGGLSAPPLAEHDGGSCRRHVADLVARLGDCRWLPAAVVDAVVRGANERLDGSGYPRGMAGADLHGLSRLVAVIDAVDCLGRVHSGERLAIDGIFDYLEGRPTLYDGRWLRLYRRHFGELPVGTLVCFDGGQLAWVRQLAADRAPLRMQLASAVALPGAANLGAWIEGEALGALDRPRALPMPLG